MKGLQGRVGKMEKSLSEYKLYVAEQNHVSDHSAEPISFMTTRSLRICVRITVAGSSLVTDERKQAQHNAYYHQRHYNPPTPNLRVHRLVERLDAKVFDWSDEANCPRMLRVAPMRSASDRLIASATCALRRSFGLRRCPNRQRQRAVPDH